MLLFLAFPKEIEDILSLAVVATSLIAALIIILLFSVSNHRDEAHIKEIADLSNSLRIFIIDVKNDQVRYFNSAHLRDRKTTSITAFYNQFTSKERENLINWIGNLLENNDETPKFIEVSVFIKSSKTSVTSILEVEKIDYSKQVIYIESHLLQTNFNSKSKGEKPEFAKKDVLFKRILLSNGKGSTFAFNFFNKRTKTSDISQLAYADIRDIMVSFTDENILVTEEKFGQILVSNFDVN